MASGSAASPLVSVVTPVYNGVRTLDRAVLSVVRQRFQGWELVAIDDGSVDWSLDQLHAWSCKDDRIRVLSSERNRGIGVVRNEAIRQARGRMICYLDCDDEYYPNYLAEVARLQTKADFLIFGYDYVQDGVQGGALRRWDPTPFTHLFFEKNLTGGASRGQALFPVFGQSTGRRQAMLWVLPVISGKERVVKDRGLLGLVSRVDRFPTATANKRFAQSLRRNWCRTAENWKQGLTPQSQSESQRP